MPTGSPRIYFSDEECLLNKARTACEITSAASISSKPEELSRVNETGMVPFL